MVYIVYHSHNRDYATRLKVVLTGGEDGIEMD